MTRFNHAEAPPASHWAMSFSSQSTLAGRAYGMCETRNHEPHRHPLSGDSRGSRHVSIHSPGLIHEHVLLTLADQDGGKNNPIGDLTKSELAHKGKRYAPKAVVGAGVRYSIGHSPTPDEFSGGEAPGQANFVLRKLGFTVGRKREDIAGIAEDERPAYKDWTEQERNKKSL